MKKTFLLAILVLAFCLSGCTSGGNSKNAQGEAESESTERISSQTGADLTQEQALKAVRRYCLANDPSLEEMEGSDEYTVYWDVYGNDKGEIVVLFRSYTGSENRFYIDPSTGEAYVTELVPGIIDEEQQTEERLNVRDYLK